MPRLTSLGAITLATTVALFWAAPSRATPFEQTYYFSNTLATSGDFAGEYSPTDYLHAGSSITFSFDFTGTASDPNFDGLEVTAAPFLQSDLSGFPGYNCLGYANAGGCVEYTVSLIDSGDASMIDSPFTAIIAWLNNTNSITQNPFILHVDQPGEGSCSPDSPSPCESLLLNNIYYPCGTIADPSGSCPDPADGGTGDNFSRFGVVYPTPVPEPATVGLLGSGIVALVLLRRRRRLPAMSRAASAPSDEAR